MWKTFWKPKPPKCYLWSETMFPQNSYVEILMTNVTVLGSRKFVKWLDDGGGFFVSKTPWIPSFLSPCALGLSCVQFFVTSCVTHQAPLPMEFSRQGCWSGLPYPPLVDLPDLGTEPRCVLHFLLWQVNSLPLHHVGSTPIMWGQSKMLAEYISEGGPCQKLTVLAPLSWT